METTQRDEATLLDLARGVTAGSIGELIELRAWTCPDRPALRSGDGREVTYAALDGCGGAWSAALARVGLAPDAWIGVGPGDALDRAVVALSVLAAGRSVVVPEVGTSALVIARLMERLDVDLVVASRREPPGPQRGHPAAARRPAGARPIALLASTDGTGDPRIVTITERQLLHRSQLAAAGRRRQAGADGPWLVELVTALVAGATLEVEPAGVALSA